MPLMDVVVVSYNSRGHLRACVDPLSRLEDVQVIVVDNASSDGSLNTIEDLPIVRIERASYGGFAKACSEGWRVGSAPFVLFLNPDATINESSLRRLVDVLEDDAGNGAVAPKIVHDDGSLAYSIRRFPRRRSTYACALFLHRILPHAVWTDEVVRNEKAYARPGSTEWVSGACILVRRSALEELGGWDERFFLYRADIDLSRRLHDARRDIRFEPSAVAVH